MSLESKQKQVCARFNAAFSPAEPDLKVGIAANALSHLRPLNGLRHPPEGDTTGWYIRAGEVLPEAVDFFQPVCVRYLPDECPAVTPYLGLAPGWRFLIAEGYEDVWFDAALLDIGENR